MARENLRRIRAGLPLLNGQSPHAYKDGKEYSNAEDADKDKAEDTWSAPTFPKPEE